MKKTRGVLLLSLAVLSALSGCGGPRPPAASVSDDRAAAERIAMKEAAARPGLRIAVAGIDSPLPKFSAFLEDELTRRLAAGPDGGGQPLGDAALAVRRAAGADGEAPVVPLRGAELMVLEKDRRGFVMGPVDDRTAAAVARRLGAGAALTGDFVRLAGFSQIRLRVVDAGSAALLGGHTLRIGNDDPLFAGFSFPKGNMKGEKALERWNRIGDLVAEGGYEEALAELENAPEGGFDPVEAYRWRGLAHIRRGFERGRAGDMMMTSMVRAVMDVKQAGRDFEALLELSPDHVQGLNNRGVACLNGDSLFVRPPYRQYGKSGFSASTTDILRALGNFEAVLRLVPGDRIAAYNRGFAWTSVARHTKAVPLFDAILKSAPECSQARFSRGAAPRSGFRDAEALADLDAALRDYPDYPWLLHLRGWTRHRSGDYDGAITDYDEALRLDPAFAQAFVDRGGAWGGKGDPGRAIADIDEALRLEPGNAEFIMERGLEYYRAGDIDRAMADFETAIGIDPVMAAHLPGGLRGGH